MTAPSHPVHAELLERMRGHAERREPVLQDSEARIPVEHYTDAARLAREQARLFRRLPLVVAHASEVAAPGACITHDATGIPVVIVRGKDGVLRGFLNACRHRATQLVAERACHKAAFVCPYHHWTYDLAGALTHVPHEQAFPSLNRADRGLVPVHVEEHAGLIWLSVGDVTDVAGFLGALSPELAALDLASHHVYRRFTTTHRANWKLVVDLFLEGYHVRTLHRRTVGPYFLDATNALERVRPHVRAVSARTTFLAPEPGAGVRDLGTPSYLAFPNSLFIAHPDFVSHMAVYPLAVDGVQWVHTMLIPEPPATDEARAHWETNVRLIEEGVFQAEDLATAEAMQRGIDTGANTDLVVGRLESAIGWFHEDIAAALTDAA